MTPELATGFWTATHTLVALNGVLAAASLVTTGFGIAAVRSSNRTAAATETAAQASQKAAQAAADQVAVGRQQADAAQEQITVATLEIEQTVKAQRAAVRPILTDVPFRANTVPEHTLPPGRLVANHTPNGATVTLPIRNIGPGPAFVHAALVKAATGLIFDAEVESNIIPSAEHSVIAAAILSTATGFDVFAAKIESGDWTVGIRYCDISGTQRLQTNLNVRRGPHGQLYVASVTLYECDDHWAPSHEPLAEARRTPNP